MSPWLVAIILKFQLFASLFQDRNLQALLAAEILTLILTLT